MTETIEVLITEAATIDLITEVVTTEVPTIEGAIIEGPTIEGVITGERKEDGEIKAEMLLLQDVLIVLLAKKQAVGRVESRTYIHLLLHSK